MRILNIEPTPDAISENKDQEVSEAIARKGDWKYDPTFLKAISTTVMNLSWTKVGEISSKDETLYIYKNGTTWIAGKFEEYPFETKTGTVMENRFTVIFRIELEVVNSIGRKFGYNKLYQVREVAVKDTYRGMNIAYNMYKWLVNNNDFAILGDRVQYFGARKLWAKLSQSMDVKVDAIDRTNDSFLEKDIVLIHGQYDAEFDKRVWSQDVSKADTLLVLTQVLN